MKTSSKTVDVIMPVHQINRFFWIALRSILDQSHRDFRLLLVLNGAAVSAARDNFTAIDPRIHPIVSKGHGLVSALNTGVESAEAEFIARMDSDDISHRDRLKKQLDYLISNDLDVIGSQIELCRRGKNTGRRSYPIDHKGCLELLLFGSCFAHPAVLGKSSIFKNHPYRDFVGAEDYELWYRLSKETSHKFGNHPEALLTYRLHPAQISSNVEKPNLSFKKSGVRDAVLAFNSFRLTKMSATQAFANDYRFNKITVATLYYMIKYPSILLLILKRIIRVIWLTALR